MMMKPEIELIRELVSTVQLLQEVVYVLEQSDTCFRAQEQRCKCFGVQLALNVVCEVFEINVVGEISDADNKQ